MSVLAIKPGHDGTVAFIDEGRLVFSLEAEKDSFARHSNMTAQVMFEALASAPTFPDVFAIGGWHKGLPGLNPRISSGYHGLSQGALTPARYFGRDVLLYTSSHERSHIIGGIAMSPFDQDQDIAVLVWEGIIGALYHWRGETHSLDRYPVLSQPGARYSALFALADASFPDSGRAPNMVFAGKLMALTG